MIEEASLQIVRVPDVDASVAIPDDIDTGGVRGIHEYGCAAPAIVRSLPIHCSWHSPVASDYASARHPVFQVFTPCASGLNLSDYRDCRESRAAPGGGDALSWMGSWQTGQAIARISLASVGSCLWARKLIRHDRHRIKMESASDIVCGEWRSYVAKLWPDARRDNRTGQVLRVRRVSLLADLI
jgi:hypothetical protein